MEHILAGLALEVGWCSLETKDLPCLAVTSTACLGRYIRLLPCACMLYLTCTPRDGHGPIRSGHCKVWEISCARYHFDSHSGEGAAHDSYTDGQALPFPTSTSLADHPDDIPSYVFPRALAVLNDVEATNVMLVRKCSMLPLRPYSVNDMIPCAGYPAVQRSARFRGYLGLPSPRTPKCSSSECIPGAEPASQSAITVQVLYPVRSSQCISPLSTGFTICDIRPVMC